MSAISGARAGEGRPCRLARKRRSRSSLFPAGLAERREREADAAGLPAELRAALGPFTRLVGTPTPAGGEAAGRAAVEVAAWAGGQGAQRTRAAFLEAAALLLESAALAYEAGRHARSAGDPARAEGWFRAAIRFGRGRDWEHYTLAHLALANSFAKSGDLAPALAFAARGRRAAQRHGLRQLRAFAFHELLIVAAKQQAESDVYEYASLALREYGRTHSRIVVLAHDVAVFWLDRGRFARALTVFEAMLPRISDPLERVCVLANLVLAAAGTADRERYERYWISTVQAVVAATDPAAAEVWLALAEAAGLLREWDHAEAAAGRALDLASIGSAVAHRERAESALALVQSRSAASKYPRRDEAPELARKADQLARSLLHSLAAP